MTFDSTCLPDTILFSCFKLKPTKSRVVSGRDSQSARAFFSLFFFVSKCLNASVGADRATRENMRAQRPNHSALSL